MRNTFRLEKECDVLSPMSVDKAHINTHFQAHSSLARISKFDPDNQMRNRMSVDDPNKRFKDAFSAFA